MIFVVFEFFRIKQTANWTRGHIGFGEEDAEGHQATDIFVIQVGTRRRCIQPFPDGHRKFHEPFPAFLFPVTRTRTHANFQGEITLEENERPNVKREYKHTDRLGDDKVHLGLDCSVAGCTEA